MTGSADPFTATWEFEDDASYSWWRNSHPDSFVLAVRARRPPVLHRSVCKDVDRDVRPGRLKAKGSRQICAEMKPALREWAKRELPEQGLLLDKCPKCGP